MQRAEPHNRLGRDNHLHSSTPTYIMHNFVDGTVDFSSVIDEDGATRYAVTIHSEQPSRSDQWMVGDLKIGEAAGSINLPSSARVRCAIKIARHQQLEFSIGTQDAITADSAHKKPCFTFLGLCHNVRFHAPVEWGCDLQVGQDETERVA